MLNKIICGPLTYPQYKHLCDVIGWYDKNYNYYDFWIVYKEKTAIDIKKRNIDGYSDYNFFKKNKNYSNYTFLTYEELIKKLKK